MFQPGHVVNGTYCVEQLLGSGGMADVYLVRHTRLPRQFALKLMLRHVANQPGVRERFRQEAEILAKLRHNHIVGVVDWDLTPAGQPFLVMEYIEGETLANFLRRTGPLSPAVALDICRQIGEGLSVAHAAGVIHRDLKPSNIFLDKNGGGPNFVKILDFGIAKVMRGGQSFTGVNAGLIGTPGYMSPEQATGGTVDSRSDQFALALILFEMLSGRSAFCDPNDTALASLARVVHEPAPELPQAALNAAVQRALSKSPEARFPSIDAFLAALGSPLHSGFNRVLTPVPPSSDGNGELSSGVRSASRLKLRRILPGTLLGVGLTGLLVLTAAPRLRGPKPAPPVHQAAAPPVHQAAAPPVHQAAASNVAATAAASPAPLRLAPPQVAPASPTVAAAAGLPRAAGTALAPHSAVAGPSRPTLIERGKLDFSIHVWEDSRLLGLNQPPAPASSSSWAIKRILQYCLEQKLKDAVTAGGSELVLERSGSLRLTSPWPSQSRPAIELCIAQQLEHAHIRPPPGANIRVRALP